MPAEDSGSSFPVEQALVTGATRGIGKAVSRMLGRLGVRVGLVARTTGELDALAREIDGWPIPCDVSDPAGVEEMVARFMELAAGPPDLVVSCAGVFSLAKVEEMSPEELERSLAVNLKGSILVARAVLPGLLKRGKGTVIQVGSVAGRRPLPGNAAYGAAKYGLRGFHEILLEELRGSGVRATLLEPAATDTPLWDPLDPDSNPDLPDRSGMLKPEEVAEAVAFVVTRPPWVQIPFLPIERV